LVHNRKGIDKEELHANLCYRKIQVAVSIYLGIYGGGLSALHRIDQKLESKPLTKGTGLI